MSTVNMKNKKYNDPYRELIEDIKKIIKTNNYEFNGVRPNEDSITHFIIRASQFCLTHAEIISVIESMMKNNKNYLADLGNHSH